jgi:nucleotide-binding universal stress UspA family protein
MFNNILLSYDGSVHSQSAARLAAELASQQNEPSLWLVCVVESISDQLQEPFSSQLIASRTTTGQALIGEALKIIGDRVAVRRELLFGDVAECVVNVAETRGCDLIVMGTRGLGPLRGLLLGSKAQRVVSLAQCPVLLVK